MELDVVIKYGAGEAVYRIQMEDPGLYFATRLRFDGSDEAAPPDEITLVRGIRKWTGSIRDEALLSDLGRSIQKALARAKPEQD